jgi:hypothetical protein
MPTDATTPPEPPEAPIAEPAEVGASVTEKTFYLWLAREGVRQGEARLDAQGRALEGFRSRATSLLAWNVAALLALAAWARQAPLALIAPTAALFAISTAALIVGLWPKKWRSGPYLWSDLVRWGCTQELQLLEGYAANLEGCHADNNKVIRLFGRCVRVAWMAFCAAPIAAGAVAIYLR